MASSAGLQDRRGFDLPLKICLGLIALSLGLLIYSWRIGLGLFTFSCVSFIVLEAVSCPPANSPRQFNIWARKQDRRKPVLLCFGDSLTHGNVSASITPEIPQKLSQVLGMPPPPYGDTFSDPLWVVNAGQNSITSHTVLHERVRPALTCHPDYILLWIGTNDMLAIYNKFWAPQIAILNEQTEPITMKTFERNLTDTVEAIQKSSPMVQIGICTLPPMGENLNAKANQIIREANKVVERVAAGKEKCTVIPVYAQFESILEKKRGWSLPVDFFFPLALIMNPLFHLNFLNFFFTWNGMSALVGNVVLSDGLHLNERGRDEVVDLIVEWLVKKNIAKAIAVKK